MVVRSTCKRFKKTNQEIILASLPYITGLRSSFFSVLVRLYTYIESNKKIKIGLFSNPVAGMEVKFQFLEELIVSLLCSQVV